eukprot:1015496_1
MPIHQWTHTQVAFSLFVHLVQKHLLSADAWQFAHYMFRLCEEEKLNGIIFYQLITKNNQTERNVMQFIQRISNQFSLSSYPLSQQMQNEIKLWAQRTLQRAKMWLAPPCKRSQPPYHPYVAHL